VCQLNGHIPRSAPRRDIVLHEAIQKWGKFAQINMCIEEMSELMKALMKYCRYKEEITDVQNMLTYDVLEEIADVQITLDQMRIIFGSTIAIEEQKIGRLRERLKKCPAAKTEN
jgi:hypothetical protein